MDVNYPKDVDERISIAGKTKWPPALVRIFLPLILLLVSYAILLNVGGLILFKPRTTSTFEANLDKTPVYNNQAESSPSNVPEAKELVCPEKTFQSFLEKSCVNYKVRYEDLPFIVLPERLLAHVGPGREAFCSENWSFKPGVCERYAYFNESHASGDGETFYIFDSFSDSRGANAPGFSELTREEFLVKKIDNVSIYMIHES